MKNGQARFKSGIPKNDPRLIIEVVTDSNF